MGPKWSGSSEAPDKEGSEEKNDEFAKVQSDFEKRQGGGRILFIQTQRAQRDIGTRGSVLAIFVQ